MTHTKHTLLSLLFGCSALLLAAGCGNSSGSGALTTARAIPVSGDLEAPSGEALNASAADAGVLEASGEVENAPAAPATARRANTRSRSRAVATTGAGLRVKRLAVARNIEDREPVDAATSFRSTNDRLFAFVEAANSGGDAGELVVTFQDEDGDEVGHITLNIPAHAPRWRTWAYSNRVSEPGSWTAIIRNSDGTELAREHFEIEG